MTDNARFRIRADLAATAPAASIAGPPSTAGWFAHPSGAVAFLAAAAGQRLAVDASCRQAPDGGWFAAVEVPWRLAAPLVWTAGGRPFAGDATSWWKVPVTGLAAEPIGAADLDAAEWPTVGLAELLARVPLRPRLGGAMSARELDAVVPGPLGRWALRRAVALGLEVRMTTARRRPLVEGVSDLEISPEAGVVVLRLRAPRGEVPRALVRSLIAMPYVFVGHAGGPGAARLLVDVRRRLPLQESLLGGMVPEDEIWALAGPEVGSFRLDEIGEEIDAEDLLTASSALAASPRLPPAEAPSMTSARLPVRSVPRKHGGRRADAVLLDGDELDWLIRLLRLRPWAESAFLLAGEEHHLLTAPGGLVEMLPFGEPVSRLDDGLYLACDLDLAPPLSEAARRRVFVLEKGLVVAVGKRGAFRFSADRLIPAWALWVGDGPEMVSEIGERGRVLLERISDSVLEHQPSPRDAARGSGASRTGRAELLEQAQHAELLGDLLRAAELLESAGEAAAAGRLYERAADAHGAR